MKKFFSKIALTLALVTSLVSVTPSALAQGMNSPPVCAGTCPTPPPSQFTVGFNGVSNSAAVNMSAANRGNMPSLGRVVSEFAEAGSRTNDANSIGVDIRVTGFQPGSICEGDCNSSRAIITGQGLSSAQGFSAHFIHTEGVNGGPASASSTAHSAGQTANAAEGTVNWMPVRGTRQPPVMDNITQPVRGQP